MSGFVGQARSGMAPARVARMLQIEIEAPEGLDAPEPAARHRTGAVPPGPRTEAPASSRREDQASVTGRQQPVSEQRG